MMKVLLVALVAVAAAEVATPSHADWLAAIDALDPEIRDGVFALITEGSSRRELQFDGMEKPETWNGVGGKKKLNVKKEKKAKKAMKKIAKKLDYICKRIKGRRELQFDGMEKPKSWNGVGGKMKLSVKTEKKANKAMMKIAKQLDYNCRMIY